VPPALDLCLNSVDSRGPAQGDPGPSTRTKLRCGSPSSSAFAGCRSAERGSPANEVASADFGDEKAFPRGGQPRHQRCL